MENKDKQLKKGQYLVEPSVGISEFIEKFNKLSFKNFPEDEVFKVFKDNPLPIELLEPYIFHSDARYTRNLIHKSNDFELVLMCWNAGQYSAIHGHEGQKCWLRVEKGALEFADYQEEPGTESKILKRLNVKTGKWGYIDGPAVIHKVANLTGNDALSLHLYAFPIDQCDIYDLDLNQKKKMPLSYHSIHGKLVALE